jgi:hypothetical protein
MRPTFCASCRIGTCMHCSATHGVTSHITPFHTCMRMIGAGLQPANSLPGALHLCVSLTLSIHRVLLLLAAGSLQTM